ncbi:MAG: ankyrin repeat domain-containing protein [Alphaproteobacteria bacterium]|nr:ankyrin repeat domain-containing protein [Alphaproteobacteria bacterium]
MREIFVRMLPSRAALIGFLVVAFPMAAAAQGATPLLDTNPSGGVPTIPFSGFQGYSDSVAAIAAQNNTRGVLGLLVGGASPNSQDYLGRSGLMYAAIFNNAMMARVLLDHDANLEVRDKLGNTALHWAAERGSADVLGMLLAAHAAVDAQNQQGVTPLMLAVANSRSAAVRTLLAAHADPHKQDYTGRDAFGWTTDNRAIAQLLNGAH